METSESAVYALVLGRVVSHLREHAGWSQLQLAATAGVTQPTLSRIERGQVLPDAFTFRKIAEAFGISSAELSQHVDAALGQTERVARTAAPGRVHGYGAQTNARKPQKPLEWWQIALAGAGAAGLAGLVAFAVATALDGGKKPGKPPPKR